jgi:adenylate/guanylate cyclase family protein
MNMNWSEKNSTSQERVQRRLAAILFADVVGYSRLIGQDDVGTWRRLQSVLRDLVRPHVKAHAGRIVRIKGDGILVEFASAVEAVASAVGLQQAMAQRNAILAEGHRLELRIGINLGDIITNDDDVQGDGVNVSARLEPLADLARPAPQNDGFGSFASITRYPRYVRSCSKSGDIADMIALRVCANSRHRDVASSRNLFRYFDRVLRCRLTRSRLRDRHWIWYTLGYIKRN